MEDRGSVCTITMDITGEEDDAIDQSEPLIKADNTETSSVKIAENDTAKSKSSSPELMSSPDSVEETPKTTMKKGKGILARLSQGRRREVADVRQMEEDLLTLLQDFHSGKLQAFGNDCTMQQMEAIREQQEKLARLHFDLGGGRDFSPDLSKPLSDEGLRQAQKNMHELSESLQELSDSIEKLHGRDTQKEE